MCVPVLPGSFLELLHRLLDFAAPGRDLSLAIKKNKSPVYHHSFSGHCNVEKMKLLLQNIVGETRMKQLLTPIK